MKQSLKVIIKRLFFSLLGLGLFLIGPIQAAETENLDIRVSLNATKSISVNTTTYAYGSLDVNTSSVSATSIVVTNDSTALIETYTLSASHAISDSGGTDWTLSSSTGPNQYALQAQFSDSRPNNNEATWDQDNLSTTPTVCSDDVLGNGTQSQAGFEVLPSGARNLWFRIKTPGSVTDSGQHTVTVTLSVL